MTFKVLELSQQRKAEPAKEAECMKAAKQTAEDIQMYARRQKKYHTSFMMLKSKNKIIYWSKHSPASCQ